MKAQELQTIFGIAGTLHFEETSSGMVRVQIATADCAATLYMQGAHLTHWQPAGESPVLFTAEHNSFIPGEPIRGGVPVIFPWFGSYAGPKRTEAEYPFHGFARTTEWSLASAVLHEEVMHLTFAWTADEQAHALGFDHFSLEYTVRLGKALTLELNVRNNGIEPLHFEDGLHTYFAVEDVAQASVDGLMGTRFLDSMNKFAMKRQTESTLHFKGEMDSIYIDTTATCVIGDTAHARKISVAKSGSNTTVVWNPGPETDPPLQGLGPQEWRKFLCVETANAHNNALSLQAGEQHTMTATITLQK